MLFIGPLGMEIVLTLGGYEKTDEQTTIGMT